MEEIDTHEDFKEKTRKYRRINGATTTTQVDGSPSTVGWRMKIWRVTDYHENSVIAKVF